MLTPRLLSISAALVVLGAVTAHLRLVPPLVGFGVALGGGGLTSMAALPLSVWEWKRRKGPLGWVLAACAIGIGAAVFVTAMPRHPRINDVTTSPEDPPSFVRRPGGSPAYPAENAGIQRSAYPDLAPVDLPQGPVEALAAVRRSAERLGLSVVDTDPATGRLEATAESGVFRFVDDVVVRIRPQGSGSRVDIRSKSRDGKGDLGKNAARIRALAAALGP